MDWKFLMATECLALIATECPLLAEVVDQNSPLCSQVLG